MDYYHTRFLTAVAGVTLELYGILLGDEDTEEFVVAPEFHVTSPA